MKIYGFTRRVVIDTNIIIAALLSPNGDTAKFMGDVFDGKYEVIITESILIEYSNVLHREKFQIDEDIINFILEWFTTNTIFVEVDESDYPKDEMSDTDDAPFYVAASEILRSKILTS